MIAALSEYGTLTRVLLKHAREAFVSDERIAAQWKSLNYTAAPDFSKALREYDRFMEIVAGSGAETICLPRHDGLTLDSIYTRDASVPGADGAILCNMGKRARVGEPAAQGAELRRRGWPIAGAIVMPGLLEGGDLIWLDARTVAVGQGRRTNADGIQQLQALLDGSLDELVFVPLPDYPSDHDVMHLMSLISPVDKDLAVVSSGLLPKAFRTGLLDRGCRLIDVPDDEFDTMGTNVLALGPRDCVMLDGNPKTRAALERAGARVQVYEGVEISLKGGGGPTCLTRPLARATLD
jgi:N-dimethylarginine dimethylaminohydrolase